jgi:hypothetical protein
VTTKAAVEAEAMVSAAKIEQKTRARRVTGRV